MKIKHLFVLFGTLFLLLSCENQPTKPTEVYNPGEVITLGLSGDSNYVISAGTKGGLLLWNIEERSYKIISKKANPLSAYFIKDSDQFIWQDDKNIFHIQDVNGKELLHFSGKRSFSNIVTSDLRYVFITDSNWQFYRYDTVEKKWERFYRGFLGFVNKPINFTLSADNKLLLSSGFCGDAGDDIPLGKPKGNVDLDCIVLWDVDKAEPIKKFWGLIQSQTYATFSGDGKIILAGSEGGATLVSSLDKLKTMQLNDLNFGRYLGNEKWDNTGLIKKPKDFLDSSGSNTADSVFNFSAITSNLYLRFTVGMKYAILYKGLSKNPIRYINLGKMPYPSTTDYSRDGSIATSIKTHTLVTGQAVFDGINVYQFDPKTERLYRVWAPIVHHPFNTPKEYSKDVPTLPGVSFKQLSEIHRVE